MKRRGEVRKAVQECVCLGRGEHLLEAFTVLELGLGVFAAHGEPAQQRSSRA